MKINDAFFKSESDSIKIFQVENNTQDFDKWELRPIDNEILLPDASGGEELDGLFIVKSVLVRRDKTVTDCYQDVSLPERIAENVYLFEDNEIKNLPKYEAEGDVIPCVAIDCAGDYELFYSKFNPNFGIKVLSDGLKLAYRKINIARDLAYILRDEERFAEAVNAFSIAINEDHMDYYLFIERAQLWDRLNEIEKAKRDWETVEELAGQQIVKMYKG